MSWMIDVIAFLGGLLLVAGVFLQYGLAYSLMIGGLLLIAFALKAARVYEENDVSNTE